MRFSALKALVTDSRSSRRATQPVVQGGQTRPYTIHMVNDEDRPRTGTLRLTYTDAAGHEVAAQERPFALTAFGAQSYTLFLDTPKAVGAYTVRASAQGEGGDATVSTRDVRVQEGAVP